MLAYISAASLLACRALTITVAVAAFGSGAAAQASKSAKNKPPATPPVAAQPSAPAAVPFVNGHRIAPKPSWVVEVDAPIKAPASHTAPSYRLLLSDVQTRLDAPGEQQQFARSRLVATESAALAEVSKAELHFNPAFQTLTLHEVAVWRDGVRQDRKPGARGELRRREARLARSTRPGARPPRAA